LRPEDAAEIVGNGIADMLSDWFDWLERVTIYSIMKGSWAYGY